MDKYHESETNRTVRAYSVQMSLFDCCCLSRTGSWERFAAPCHLRIISASFL